MKNSHFSKIFKIPLFFAKTCAEFRNIHPKMANLLKADSQNQWKPVIFERFLKYEANLNKNKVTFDGVLKKMLISKKVRRKAANLCAFRIKSNSNMNVLIKSLEFKFENLNGN